MMEARSQRKELKMSKTHYTTDADVTTQSFASCDQRRPNPTWAKTTTLPEVTCGRCRPDAVLTPRATVAAPAVDHARIEALRVAAEEVEAEVARLEATYSDLEAQGADADALAHVGRKILALMGA